MGASARTAKLVLGLVDDVEDDRGLDLSGHCGWTELVVSAYEQACLWSALGLLWAGWDCVRGDDERFKAQIHGFRRRSPTPPLLFAYATIDRPRGDRERN